MCTTPRTNIRHFLMTREQHSKKRDRPGYISLHRRILGPNEVVQQMIWWSRYPHWWLSRNKNQEQLPQQPILKNLHLQSREFFVNDILPVSSGPCKLMHSWQMTDSNKQILTVTQTRVSSVGMLWSCTISIVQWMLLVMIPRKGSWIRTAKQFQQQFYMTDPWQGESL